MRALYCHLLLLRLSLSALLLGLLQLFSQLHMPARAASAHRACTLEQSQPDSFAVQMWNVPIADFRTTYNAEEPDAGPESSKGMIQCIPVEFPPACSG